jgi:hypothetical protein
VTRFVFVLLKGENEMQTDGKPVSPVGSWSAVITAVNQAVTFPGLLTFTSDGVFLADEPPAPFETSGHGNWIRTGPSSIAYTFLTLYGGSEGKLSAKAKVIGSLQYNPQEKGWAGPFTIEVVDADGSQIASDHGEVKCTWIAVEDLA